MSPSQPARRAPAYRISGLTLIDIMVVVAIIGILGSIALSMYQDNLLKSRRRTAQSCLAEQAQYMERYYTTKETDPPLTYTGATLPTSACVTDLASYYSISVSIPTPQTYTLTATASGSQTGDTECTNLTLDQSATRGSFYYLANAKTTSSGCWP
jgi:type IV pilus assembly protein PilE